MFNLLASLVAAVGRIAALLFPWWAGRRQARLEAKQAQAAAETEALRTRLEVEDEVRNFGPRATRERLREWSRD